MKNLFILLIVSISMICAQDIPDWITNIPSDDDYYWALEEIMTLNMNESEYKTKANEQALLTISMQIKATVSGTVEMSATETTESLDESFTMKTFSSTMADIEGAEKVSEFQMAAKYWVLWRLKKSTHQESMARHVESAIGFYEGFTYVSDTDPVTQLQYLISAYENIVKVVGMDVIFEEKTDLRVEIPNKIRSINNALRLVSDGPNSFTGKVGFALSKPLKVKVIVGEEVVPTGLPIRFSFSDGEGSFENELVTMSSTGKSETKISKIISRKRVQRVRAQVDLNELRENRMSRFPAFEAHLNGISQTNSISFTIDVAEVTQEKIAVITVGDTLIYSEDDLKRLNRSFRSEFADVTDFKLKDEALIEGIIESYKRSSSLCANDECQVAIGKKLGVEKLIFIDIADYPKQTTVTIFLRNIAENELEQEYTYSYDHSMDAGLDEKIGLILEDAPYMVQDFWYRNNPGYLTMACNIRGIKANIQFLDPTEWMDKSYVKRLPLNSEKFFEGEYELSINKLGFEKYHTRFEVAMGDFPEYNIELKAKRPGKALLKSLLIPGRGQMYANDKDNRSRLWMGLTYFSTSIGLAGGSGFMWKEFSDAKIIYESAKTNYQEAILTEDIETMKALMISKHTIMSDKRNMATTLTSITAGIWLWNVIDAYLFFPKEYKTKRLTLRMGNQLLAGESIPTSNLEWHF